MPRIRVVMALEPSATALPAVTTNGDCLASSCERTKAMPRAEKSTSLHRIVTAVSKLFKSVYNITHVVGGPAIGSSDGKARGEGK